MRGKKNQNTIDFITRPKTEWGGEGGRERDSKGGESESEYLTRTADF